MSERMNVHTSFLIPYLICLFVCLSWDLPSFLTHYRSYRDLHLFMMEKDLSACMNRCKAWWHQ